MELFDLISHPQRSEVSVAHLISSLILLGSTELDEGRDPVCQKLPPGKAPGKALFCFSVWIPEESTVFQPLQHGQGANPEDFQFLLSSVGT